MTRKPQKPAIVAALTRSAAAALDYLWRYTEYQRVYAVTDSPNDKSVQVMLRLGMTHESTTDSIVTYLLRRPT